jgi:sarcosine oxidase, subunit delta
MKIMSCPLNGPRNISEFVWGGEVKIMPDPTACSDRDWADYVFMENNKAGFVREWWCHVPTSFWFIAERNTVTDEIIRTYPAGDLFDRRVEMAAKPKDAPK